MNSSFFREINNALSFQNLSLDDISQAYLEGNKDLVKILHMPVPVTKVVPVNEVYQQEALGFGSLYPELTEKMYRNNMEKIDMDAWAEMRAHGATFPKKPVKVTLEEEERIILQWLAIYAAEYYPELLNSLNLKDYLDNSLS